MADFNFFEPYIEPPVQTNYVRLMWFVAYGALIIAITYTQIGFLTDKALVESDIQQELSFINSKNVTDRLTAIQEKEVAFQALSGVNQELTDFKSLLDYKGQLQVGLFDLINQQVPEYVYVSAYNITVSQVVISGYSDSYESIALFQHQLRGIDRFSQVFIPSIVEEAGNYVFTITAAFKPEVPNENE